MFDRRVRRSRRIFGLREVHQICRLFGQGHDLKSLCEKFQIREASFWYAWRRWGGWTWHELEQYREMLRLHPRLVAETEKLKEFIAGIQRDSAN